MGEYKRESIVKKSRAMMMRVDEEVVERTRTDDRQGQKGLQCCDDGAILVVIGRKEGKDGV